MSHLLRFTGHAGVPAPASQPLPQGWERAYDQSRGAYYYFNRSTGVSQWHAPGQGSVECALAAYC